MHIDITFTAKVVVALLLVLYTLMDWIIYARRNGIRKGIASVLASVEADDNARAAVSRYFFASAGLIIVWYY